MPSVEGSDYGLLALKKQQKYKTLVVDPKTMHKILMQAVSA